MHAPMPWNGEGDVPSTVRAFMVYSSYWTLPCVCLFFAVSGALLLPTKIEPSESGQWLKKRLNKVIWPTLVWSFFYMIIVWIQDSEISLGGAFRQIMSIPFNRQGHGVLWFMYTLVGLYLVAPVISPWLERCGRRTLRVYLGLWAISLCYPVLTAFVEINDTPYGILYYFSGFLGYFVLGHYLHTYGLEGRTWWYIALLICLMPLTLLYKMFIEGNYAFGKEIFWYLGPVCPMMLICWWKICCTIADKIHGERMRSAITMLSNLSFGVYLMHIFIMRICLYRLTEYISNYYLQTFCTICLTVFIAIPVSYLFSKLPFADYFIGYKNIKE